jgi:hypothetical protein
MAKKNPAGWVVLLLVLALPGFAFYFWWNHLGGNRPAPRKLAKAPPFSRVFNAAPPGTKVSIPRVSNSLGAPISGPQPGAKSPAITKTTPAVLAHPSASSPSSKSLLNSGKAVAATPALAATLKSAAQNSQKLTLPNLKRDPTLSPADRQEIYDLLHPKPKPKIVRRRIKKKRGPPIESLIDLSGIIFMSPSNAKAIINGNLMKVGQMVHGAKIIKIEKQKVVFSYHGRKVIKVMNNKL